MKLFFITDTHHGVRRTSSSNHKKKNGRDGDYWQENIKSFYQDFFIPFLKERFNPKEDVLVHLGDVYDVSSAEYINISDYNFTMDTYAEINQVIEQAPFYLLVGNHDMRFEHKLEDNAVDSLKHLGDNIKVVDSLVKIDNLGGKSVLMLPYIRSAQMQKTLLHGNKADLLLCHSDVYGAKLSSREGDVLKTSLVREDFDNYGKILSGHIHIRQSLFKKRWLYLGSPYQMDLNDIYTEKGVYYLDLDEGKLHFEKNDHNPEFVYLNIDSNLDLDSVDVEHYKKQITLVNVDQKSFAESDQSYNRMQDLIREINPYKVSLLTRVKDDVVQETDASLPKSEAEFNEVGPEFYSKLPDMVGEELTESAHKDLALEELNIIIENHKNKYKLV